MTQKTAIFTLSVAAAGALTAERFITAGGATATAAGNAIGVSESLAKAAGDLVPTIAVGTAIVTAGGAIAKGAAVEVGAGGKAVTRTTGVKVGTALQAAAADGDRIEVFLVPN